MTKKLALFDIDGVLADDRHRVHYALDRNWTKYFDKHLMFNDGVWPEGVTLVRGMVEDGWTPGYLTGRREDLRWTTTAWLAVNDFPVGDDVLLLMRDFKRGVPLANLKVGILQDLIDSGEWEEVLLFDDDPEVIRLVTEVLGPEYSRHCTWHIKETALVKKATA